MESLFNVQQHYLRPRLMISFHCLINFTAYSKKSPNIFLSIYTGIRLREALADICRYHIIVRKRTRPSLPLKKSSFRIPPSPFSQRELHLSHQASLSSGTRGCNRPTVLCMPHLSLPSGRVLTLYPSPKSLP